MDGKKSQRFNTQNLANLKSVRLPEEVHDAQSILTATLDVLRDRRYSVSDAVDAVTNLTFQWSDLICDQLGFPRADREALYMSRPDIDADSASDLAEQIKANIAWTEKLLRAKHRTEQGMPITQIDEHHLDAIVYTLVHLVEYLLLEIKKDREAIPPGFMTASTVLHVATTSRTSTPAAEWHATFLLNYLRCIDAASMIDRMASISLVNKDHLRVHEAALLDALNYLHEHSHSAPPPTAKKIESAHFAFSNQLWQHVQFIRTDSEATGPSPHSGLFSALRTNEIVALAERRTSSVTRYGSKNVEAAYEGQVALLWQSLGATVIRTRRGERTVDVLGLFSATPPDRSYLFLAEAKSTSSKYSLPTSDQRALAEYIRHVQESLTGYPPLRFALICGPTPAKTVAEKVLILSREARIPIRYVSASAIVRLRESLAGPVDPLLLERFIGSCGPVLTDRDFEPLIRQIELGSSAYSEAIRLILELRR